MRDRRDAGRVARAILERCGQAKAPRARACALGLLSKGWLAPNQAVVVESVDDDDIKSSNAAAPEAFEALGVLLGQLATSRCTQDEVDEVVAPCTDLLLVVKDAN